MTNETIQDSIQNTVECTLSDKAFREYDLKENEYVGDNSPSINWEKKHSNKIIKGSMNIFGKVKQNS